MNQLANWAAPDPALAHRDRCPPNVGKKQPFQLYSGISGEPLSRSACTTRDVLASSCRLRWMARRLIDTAGTVVQLRIRSSQKASPGVGRKMAAADLIVLVFDATVPWTRETTVWLGWPSA